MDIRPITRLAATETAFAFGLAGAGGDGADEEGEEGEEYKVEWSEVVEAGWRLLNV